MPSTSLSSSSFSAASHAPASSCWCCGELPSSSILCPGLRPFASLPPCVHCSSSTTSALALPLRPLGGRCPGRDPRKLPTPRFPAAVLSGVDSLPSQFYDPWQLSQTFPTLLGVPLLQHTARLLLQRENLGHQS